MGESSYQQPTYDWGAFSSSQGPDYDHSYDDPLAWSYYPRFDDLHLGQKPKLGERYTDITLIYISCSVGTLHIHVSLSFWFLFLLSKTQKDQKYFCCFSPFVYFYLLFVIRKIQKYFPLFVFPS